MVTPLAGKDSIGIAEYILSENFREVRRQKLAVRAHRQRMAQEVGQAGGC